MVDHTCFPKEDHLLDWARWDNKVTKGDRVDTFDGFFQPTSQKYFFFWGGGGAMFCFFFFFGVGGGG